MSFTTKTLTDWEDVRSHARDGWLFRGHRCSTWSLQTSLERFFERHNIDDKAFQERLLIREFQRAYDQFGAHTPDSDAHMEWLALMQHHGAPTRALDFTYSIYVAAYFALERAKGESAVWAVNAKWAVRESEKAAQLAGKVSAARIGQRWFKSADESSMASLFFEEPHVGFACPLNPFLLNDRLRAQRGAFIVPGDITKAFEANLQALHGHEDPGNVMCLKLPASIRKRALRDLFHMNVSRASLFPGLDGYAQMLGVYHPNVVDPLRWKRTARYSDTDVAVARPNFASRVQRKEASRGRPTLRRPRKRR